MGEGPTERIARYRAGAEQCMAMAEQADSPEMRGKFIDMAAAFMRLARTELDAVTVNGRNPDDAEAGPAGSH